MDLERRRIARRNREVSRRFEAAQPYLHASRRVRETYARHELANILNWAFGGVETVNAPDDELESFVEYVGNSLRVVEPLFADVAELDDLHLDDFRAELVEAYAKIRACAQSVADGIDFTPAREMMARVFVGPRAFDRDGRPSFGLHVRLADALVWITLKLFSEVPRSLIRPCAFEGCTRIYVAAKNQRYCSPHQMEAHRESQQRAGQAFRERQQRSEATTKKLPTKRKRPRK